MNLTALAALVLTITTQNVRVSLPPDQARHDIRQAAEHSSVLLTQEMGLRRASQFAPTGWGTAHLRGIRRGDCATYWDRADWHLHTAWGRMLTDAPFRAGLRYALATTFRGRGPYAGQRLAVVCVHSITRSLQRRAVFHRGMIRLGVLLDRLDARYAHVVVGGDWNRVWSLRARFAGFRSVSPSRSTGPQGGRVDYFDWHGLAFRHERIVGDTYSDHNGTRVRLSW